MRMEYTEFILAPRLGLKKDGQAVEQAGLSILSYDAGNSIVN